MKRTRKTAGNSGSVTVGLDTFPNNLRRARVKAGMSQSDLARKIWGTKVDASGYTVARRRDRISAYEAGKELPSSEALIEVAKALDMTPQELAPELSRAPEFQDVEAISMTAVKGQSGRVLLRVNCITSIENATRIISLLSADIKK